MADTKSAKTTTTAKAPEQTKLQVKEEGKKPVAEVKADVKKETVKEPAKKAETPATEKKTEEKKTPARRGRKPGSKNSTTRKTVARKTTKKETMDEKTEVFVQYGGNEYSEKSIMQKVEAAWEAEGKKISAIKKVKLYVKPEDKRAYYVINEGLKNGSTGAVEL